MSTFLHWLLFAALALGSLVSFCFVYIEVMKNRGRIVDIDVRYHDDEGKRRTR